MHTTNRVALAVVGASAAAALLVGCGGSSSPSITTSAAVPTQDNGARVDPDNGASLPPNWPSDVPLPTGLTLINGTAISKAMSVTYKGPGTVQQIKDQLLPALSAAGWTEETGLDGGVTAWSKGIDKRIQVTIVQSGADVGVHMTLVDTTS